MRLDKHKLTLAAQAATVPTNANASIATGFTELFAHSHCPHSLNVYDGHSSSPEYRAQIPHISVSFRVHFEHRQISNGVPLLVQPWWWPNPKIAVSCAKCVCCRTHAEMWPRYRVRCEVSMMFTSNYYYYGHNYVCTQCVYARKSVANTEWAAFSWKITHAVWYVSEINTFGSRLSFERYGCNYARGTHITQWIIAFDRDTLCFTSMSIDILLCIYGIHVCYRGWNLGSSMLHGTVEHGILWSYVNHM